MHRDENGKMLVWRSEVVDIINVIREKQDICRPRRQRADTKRYGSPDEIGGLSLKYHDFLSTPRKMIKFQRALIYVLGLLDLEPVFTIQPPVGRYVMFSFQVFRKEQ